MNGPLVDKRIVLGVTGSIACYKAVDLASKLTQAGALVDTIMTYGATQFVTPLAFRSITHRQVVTNTFDIGSEFANEHVALAKSADIVVIAPATVNCIAKLSVGMADDPLTTTVIATRAPLLVAPAMDGSMFDHPATQENLARLRERGAVIAGPAPGRLASGLVGMGRLLETPELLGYITATLGRGGDLAGRTIVVSAGGTQEPIDPVRVITNNSSGKMGYSLAEAARDRGARAVLVSAPTSLPDPPLVKVVRVQTAQQMCDTVLSALEDADALIMAAA
ncbi:MAG TPA: bifunctional phosphopantothenoylcysteine decarboxylase/phosphopantothenate--cysteine ligase CoaBC, partial [Dehalococcoidia bacterium]|nr:bifunctional phosphopantothenoylcysteine decarboxylase/phosphopantothenate--cysteine ligase CoaBC [Dehalococcoidia bacterium]